ncbi:MAG TPA: potassium-transporting ATPase subunit B, partial [Paenibacillus sp.]
MSTVKRKKLLTGPILLSAVKDSFIKLNPVTLIKNPVMFVVEVGTIIVLLMVLAPGYFNAEQSIGFNITVLFILLFTVLFANFA